MNRDRCQLSLLFNCRKRTSNSAISAVQICVFSALAEVPTKLLMRRFCFRPLKNNSTCQRSLLIGVGKGGMCGRLRHAEVAQLAFGGKQSFFDFAQTFGLTGLAKEHGDQLIPGSESARMALAAMRVHGTLEQRGGNEFQHLAENAGYSIHGAPSRRGVSFLPELILTLPDERLSYSCAMGRGANLDTSAPSYSLLNPPSVASTSPFSQLPVV